MNEKAVKKLEDSPIKYLISTDTLNNPYIRNSSKIKIISVAQLFGETISRIHKNKSISNLSENFPQKTIKIEVV